MEREAKGRREGWWSWRERCALRAGLDSMRDSQLMVAVKEVLGSMVRKREEGGGAESRTENGRGRRRRAGRRRRPSSDDGRRGAGTSTRALSTFTLTNTQTHRVLRLLSRATARSRSAPSRAGQQSAQQKMSADDRRRRRRSEDEADEEEKPWVRLRRLKAEQVRREKVSRLRHQPRTTRRCSALAQPR